MIFNNVLTTPVVTVNNKVKDALAVVTVNIQVKAALAIPAGIPTTVAYEAILKVPNDADSVIKSLPA